MGGRSSARSGARACLEDRRRYFQQDEEEQPTREKSAWRAAPEGDHMLLFQPGESDLSSSPCFKYLTCADAVAEGAG